jgi:ribosome biogenesis GTPase
VLDLAQGTVIASHGSLTRVQIGDRTVVVAARRRLQWEGAPPSDPRLVVGDRVGVEMRPEGGVVVSVRQRRTSLVRQAPRSERPQVLAANVDQALVVLAARRPEPSPGLLDRFLLACDLARIEPVIVVNKADQGLEEVEPWLPVYGTLGYRVLLVSARSGRGLGEVTRVLTDRTTLFCGPSGAGKSSLLNAVHPGFRLKVGSISEATGKGRHTTSRAELMPLPAGGFVVDTPGLKEFGVWGMSPRQLVSGFREVAALADSCRFVDCQHLREPDCAVRAAVEAGAIGPSRYRSYVTLLGEVVRTPGQTGGRAGVVRT